MLTLSLKHNWYSINKTILCVIRALSTLKFIFFLLVYYHVVPPITTDLTV